MKRASLIFAAFLMFFPGIGSEAEDDRPGEQYGGEVPMDSSTRTGGASAEKPAKPKEDAPGTSAQPVQGKTSGGSIIAVDSLASRAVGMLGKESSAVMRRGRPLAVIFDFDGNGYTDVCILTVATGDRAAADVAVLSDYSRIFRDPPESILFSLDLFLQDRGKLRHSASIGLGRKLVFDSVALLPLSNNDSYPIAVAVEFLTAQGSETEWVVFYGKTEYGRFTLTDTTESRALVGDADRDGILDVMILDRVVEEGTGYETFVTLYQWAGTEYREKGTINIVRNLKTFLQKAREQLVTRGGEEFLKFALPERTLKAESAVHSTAEILSRLFTPAVFPGTGRPMPDNPILDRARILDVFFPDISESPFTFEGDRGYRFSLPLRIRFEGSGDYYYDSTIQLNRNPFSSRQYFFLLK